MIQAAEHTTQVLGLPEIFAEVGEKTFWEIAEPGTQYPFINFSITDEGSVTKNGITQYTTQLRIYSKNLTEGSRIGTVIKDAIEESEHRWKFQSMRSAYTDPEAKEAYIELNFEYKL